MERDYFSQMLLILYEIRRKSGVFILRFCIRCINFLTGEDDIFDVNENKIVFKHNVSCLTNINSFSFRNKNFRQNTLILRIVVSGLMGKICNRGYT